MFFVAKTDRAIHVFCLGIEQITDFTPAKRAVQALVHMYFLIFVGSSDVRLTQPPSIFQLPPLQKDVSFIFVTKGALQSV